VKGWTKEKDSGVHESVTIDDIRNAVKPRSGSAIFNNEEAVQEVVNELTKAELGFSVVISGIIDEVHKISERAGTRAHTVNMSGETLGKMSLLPEPGILEITTMCGHHFVAASLVRYLLERVRLGRMTAKDAALEMAKQCTCNFFNADRASKLIEVRTT
jgi:hypothetical protein